jgi:branched-subunit amino acid aminotransferase/4-amino-4-deoxychorismate lyase
LEAVSRRLRSSGWHVERRRASLLDLHAAQTVYIVNSLMLVMPVESLDGRRFPQPSPAQAELLRRDLLNEP